MEIEKCNGNREGNTIVISEMHSEFCSWKLKKCNGNREGNMWYQKCIVNFALGNWKKYYGNSEGNTIVISEMHITVFL